MNASKKLAAGFTMSMTLLTFGIAGCSTDYPNDQSPMNAQDTSKTGPGLYGGTNSTYDQNNPARGQNSGPGYSNSSTNTPPGTTTGNTPGTSSYGGSNTAGSNSETPPNRAAPVVPSSSVNGGR